MYLKTDGHEFTPELVSRRGEMIAWGSTLLVCLAWITLSQVGQRIHIAVPMLALILLLASLSISLGNWMDRKTLISIDSESISFRNGLRKVQFQWEDIQQVRVTPSTWGDKVHVIGNQAHFEFRTLGEVKVQGEIKGRMGFSEGNLILERILKETNLIPAHQHVRETANHKRTSYYQKRQ